MRLNSRVINLEPMGYLAHLTFKIGQCTAVCNNKIDKVAVIFFCENKVQD